MAYIDITGQKFGRWTALQRTEHKKKVRYICRCDCGVVREVLSTDLRNGKSKSCGCLCKENIGQGLSSKYAVEHNSWAGMKQRCNYPGHVTYHRYGGRGIAVCQQWIDSFEQFLKDMGPRPEGCSLDRIDTDKGYSPDNCRWASKQEQSANTSRNVRVEHNGELLTLKQYAAAIGVEYFRLHSFYRRRGFDLEESVRRCRLPAQKRIGNKTRHSKP